MNDRPAIAVIGTGIMGSGIAANFLKHGHAVTVWNRSPARARALAKQGALVAAAPREAAAKADAVFEVTANDESSRAAWLGEEGILAGAGPRAALVTCATLSAAWTDELARSCATEGRTFLDMPMTGGRVAAESGKLTLLAGGDETALAGLRPLLAAIAGEVKYFGPAGSGMRYKLILNTLQAIHIAGFGEALRLARAAGLDERLVGAALAERPGGVITQLTWKDYPNGPAPINFAVEWIAKDLAYAAGVADALHPLLDLALAEYRKKIADGEAQADWTAIAKD